jgi:hypothetical protein
MGEGRLGRSVPADNPAPWGASSVAENREPGGVAGWGTAGTSAMTLVGRELPLSLRLCAVPAKRRLSQASCAEAIEGAPEVYADELAERIYRAMTAAAKA